MIRPASLCFFGMLALVGCSEDDTKGKKKSPAGGTVPTGLVTGALDGTGLPVGVPDSGDTSDSTAPTVDVYDCDLMPAPPFTVTTLPGVFGNHALVIDPNDMMIGQPAGNQDLWASDYAGVGNMWLADVGDVEGIVQLANGNLIMAHNLSGNLVERDQLGAQTIILAGVGAGDLRFGPDGKLWFTSNNQAISRIDLNTGDTEVVLPIGVANARAFEFNPAGTRMYVAQTNALQVLEVQLDANYDPVGGPTVLATINGANWAESVGVDACGYIYVAEQTTSALYRFAPDGTASIAHNPANPMTYGHTLTWGNGQGGWLENGIYMTVADNGNQVMEIDIGVPSRYWAGTIINPPPGF